MTSTNCIFLILTHLLLLGKEMRITGLDPGTTYDFYLSAGNQVGFGKSLKLRIKTPRTYTNIGQNIHGKLHPFFMQYMSKTHFRPKNR